MSPKEKCRLPFVLYPCSKIPEHCCFKGVFNADLGAAPFFIKNDNLIHGYKSKATFAGLKFNLAKSCF
jgi:hypothetical protein